MKDRFGSQIRTHYPLEIATELDIVRQEARSTSVGGIDVRVPDYLAEVIATVSHLARASTHVNQRSGVSVRLSVTNYEVVAANALRRGLRAGERVVVPRVDDLDALAASSGGKIEIESLDEGREGAVFDNLVKGAVLTVFKARVAPEQTRDVDRRVRGGRDRPHRRGHPVERPRRPRRVGARRCGRPSLRSPAATSRPAAVAAAVYVRARGPAPVQAPEQGHLAAPAPRTAAAAERRRAAAGSAGGSASDVPDHRDAVVVADDGERPVRGLRGAAALRTRDPSEPIDGHVRPRQAIGG